MSDLGAYFDKKNLTEAAFQAYNYAGQKLENAKIHERLAEIKSQHEPLAALISGLFPDLDRDGAQKMRAAIYAASFFVVVGRFPAKVEDKT